MFWLLLAQGPILGDINGDGEVDIVLCTSSGHIWALNGKTGETLHNFPVQNFKKSSIRSMK
jgi:outer membrane protein assembly factor BamB